MTATTQREVVILPDAAALTNHAVEEFLQSMNEAIAQKGSFTVALSGGSTPKTLYARLADDPALRGKIPWSKLHFFFGDERHAPPDSPESNFRNWVGKLFTERITLTAAAANHANRVIFLVSRSDKALALKAVLEGPYEPEQLPAQLIQPTSGNLLWLLD